MKLNDLRDNPGARHYRKRVGRGIGSGTGKTSARGQKGQKSRNTVAPGFEGGQMPLYRRLPKRGFHNRFAKNFQEVTLARLQRAIDAKKLDTKGTIDEDALVAAGVIKKKRDGVRLLNKGEFTAKATLSVTGATKGAISAVEAAGGKVTVTGPAGTDAEKGKEEA